MCIRQKSKVIKNYKTKKAKKEVASLKVNNIYDFYRKSDVVKDWKEKSFKASRKKCVCSKKTKDLEVHHLYSFSSLVKEAVEGLDYKFSIKVKDYTSDQLKEIELRLKQLHLKTGLGVVLTKRVHILFHTIYGGQTTTEDFNNFKEIYFPKTLMGKKQKQKENEEKYE